MVVLSAARASRSTRRLAALSSKRWLAGDSARTSLPKVYTGMIEKGEIVDDQSQRRVVAALQRVSRSLEGYTAPKVSLLESHKRAVEDRRRREEEKNGVGAVLNDKFGMAFSLLGGSLARMMRKPSSHADGPRADASSGEPQGELVLTKMELLRRPDLVAVDGILYDLDSFMPKHPGGPVVQNVGGTDATAVFREMHIEAIIKRAPKVLEKYKVGRLVSGGNGDERAAEAETDSFFPRGLYIWGGPGCGKTFLADLFFEHAPVAKKRRVHFHQFMIEVHQKQHALKQAGLGADIWLRIADDLKASTELLCLDEFMVSDVADAMIVGELFKAIWKGGVVVVATSNREPADLYKNGIQRHLFMPFVHELERRCKVVRLKSDKDYRLEIMERAKHLELETHDRFFAVRPAGARRNEAFETIWAAYTGGNHIASKMYELGHRRRVMLREVCEELNAVRIPFADLCGETEQPMGVADYLVMATEFDVVFVEELPQLDFDDLDTMRRWISFVDIMYDERILVVVDGARPINDLLRDEGLDEAELSAKLLAGKVDVMGDEYLAQTVHDLNQPGDAAYQTQAGQESVDEIFAFNRMRSRLHEMQGAAYMLASGAQNKAALSGLAEPAQQADVA